MILRSRLQYFGHHLVSGNLSRNLVRCPRATSAFTQFNGNANRVRSYSSRIDEELERQNYDNQRAKIMRSIETNPEILNTSSIVKKRMPLRTTFLAIFITMSLTMGLYVIVEIDQIKQAERSGKEPTNRSLFLPLWVNLNYFYTSKYSLLKGLKYFDDHFYRYFTKEISQLNSSQDSDIDNYVRILQKEDVEFRVVEEVSLNSYVRSIFGLPFTVINHDDSHFKIWVQSDHSTISGLRIDLPKDTGSVVPSWYISVIDFNSWINDVLSSVGMGLDRLGNSDAHNKISEKASGRYHEVAKANRNTSTGYGGTKNYRIVFSGRLSIQDNKDYNHGLLIYQGTIDLDHLAIHRGVKITSVDLLVNSKSTNESTKYKIL